MGTGLLFLLMKSACTESSAFNQQPVNNVSLLSIQAAVHRFRAKNND